MGKEQEDCLGERASLINDSNFFATSLSPFMSLEPLEDVERMGGVRRTLKKTTKNHPHVPLSLSIHLLYFPHTSLSFTCFSSSFFEFSLFSFIEESSFSLSSFTPNHPFPERSSNNLILRPISQFFSPNLFVLPTLPTPYKTDLPSFLLFPNESSAPSILLKLTGTRASLSHLSLSLSFSLPLASDPPEPKKRGRRVTNLNIILFS